MTTRINRITFSLFCLLIIAFAFCSFKNCIRKEKGFLVIMKEQTIFIKSDLKSDKEFFEILNGSLGYEISYRSYSKELISKARIYDAEVNYNLKDSSFIESIKIGILPVEIRCKILNNISANISNVLFRIREIDYVFKFDMNSHRDILSVTERK